MSRPGRRDDTITPSLLLRAYACGIFPMAESADDPNLFWVEPTLRGVLPLDHVHIPRRLARTVRSDTFEIRIDSDFDAVIEGCAAPQPGRRATWINGAIRRLYGELFRAGHVHTVEAWSGTRLAGGLYGLSLAGAFFGESMFSAERDASKVALVHLVARLRRGGYALLDTQFITDHLMQFGTVELPREEYLERLSEALRCAGRFACFPEDKAAAGRRPVSGRAAVEAVVARPPSQARG